MSQWLSIVSQMNWPDNTLKSDSMQWIIEHQWITETNKGSFSWYDGSISITFKGCPNKELIFNVSCAKIAVENMNLKKLVDHLLWRIKNDLITKQNCQKQTTNRRITVTLAYVIFTAYEGNRRIFCLDWVFLLNFTGCTEKVSEACTHKSFEIIQTVDINQSNSSLIPATTKRQNNWIESCAAYAEFCRSHILPMMN